MSTAKELGEHLKRLIKELAPQPTPYAFKAIDQLVSLAPAETAAGVNQCDGCAQGAPISGGLHRDKDGRAFMTCEAHKYASPQPPATMTEEQINKLVSASEVYQYHLGAILEFARAIEQFHGIGIPKESEHG